MRSGPNGGSWFPTRRLDAAAETQLEGHRLERLRANNVPDQYTFHSYPLFHAPFLLNTQVLTLTVMTMVRQICTTWNCSTSPTPRPPRRRKNCSVSRLCTSGGGAIGCWCCFFLTAVCVDQGRLPSLRQVNLIQNYRAFTEGDLMAIKSTTSLHHYQPQCWAHHSNVDCSSSSSSSLSSSSSGSYPELRVMCNWTSFQDTVAWTFESSETTRDPDLCARWLEFLRGRLHNGTAQLISLVVHSHSSTQAAAAQQSFFRSNSLTTTVYRRRYEE